MSTIGELGAFLARETAAASRPSPVREQVSQFGTSSVSLS